MKDIGSIFVGGAERACSTSLHSYLLKHSEIITFLDKEPSFFNLYNAYGELNASLIHGGKSATEDYNKYKSSSEVILDATPLYLTDPVAPHLIKELVDAPKFIFVLRNPIERYISGVAWKSTQASSGNKNLNQIDEFELFKSIYSKGLKTYINLFGSKNIKIFCFDEFKKDSAMVTSSVNQFLGLKKIDAVITRENQYIGERRFPFIYSLNRFFTKLSFKYGFIKNILNLIKKTPLRQNIIMVRDSFISVEKSNTKIHLNHTLKQKFIDEIYNLQEQDFITKEIAEAWKEITHKKFKDINKY